VNDERQIVQVMLEKIWSRERDDLVNLELVDSDGCGVGKVLTWDDLVYLRDELTEYLSNHLPLEGDA